MTDTGAADLGPTAVGEERGPDAGTGDPEGRRPYGKTTIGAPKRTQSTIIFPYDDLKNACEVARVAHQSTEGAVP